MDVAITKNRNLQKWGEEVKKRRREGVRKCHPERSEGSHEQSTIVAH